MADTLHVYFFTLLDAYLELPDVNIETVHAQEVFDALRTELVEYLLRQQQTDKLTVQMEKTLAAVERSVTVWNDIVHVYYTLGIIAILPFDAVNVVAFARKRVPDLNVYTPKQLENLVALSFRKVTRNLTYADNVAFINWIWNLNQQDLQGYIILQAAAGGALDVLVEHETFLTPQLLPQAITVAIVEEKFDVARFLIEKDDGIDPREVTTILAHAIDYLRMERIDAIIAFLREEGIGEQALTEKLQQVVVSVLSEKKFPSPRLYFALEVARRHLSVREHLFAHAMNIGYNIQELELILRYLDIRGPFLQETYDLALRHTSPLPITFLTTLSKEFVPDPQNRYQFYKFILYYFIDKSYVAKKHNFGVVYDITRRNLSVFWNSLRAESELGLSDSERSRLLQDVINYALTFTLEYPGMLDPEYNVFFVLFRDIAKRFPTSI